MLKHALIVLCAVSLLFVATAQERTKKKTPPDFLKTIEKAKKSWEAESYGACLKDLQICTNLVTKKRTAKTRAALPAAPEGWKIRPEKDPAEQADNPMLAAMTASVGNIVERTYMQDGGNGRIEVSVMADSPMVQMLSVMFANPAAAGPKAEKIGYGDHEGMLTPQGGYLGLQILNADAHVADIKLHPPQGMEPTAAEDLLFAVFDQAAVDRLAAALTK